MERIVIQDYEKCEENDRLAEQAGSKAGLTGAKLRSVHYQMGLRIGNCLADRYSASHTVIIPMLTGALPFAFGIGNTIDVPMMLYDPHHGDPLPETDAENIILVDEVINSGKKILEIAGHYAANHHVILATTVMPKNSEAFDSPYDIYTFRVSGNRYKGAMTHVISSGKGPDTAARLYQLL